MVNSPFFPEEGSSVHTKLARTHPQPYRLSFFILLNWGEKWKCLLGSLSLPDPARLLCPFSMQEYWMELPFFPPGDLPDPGIEPRSPFKIAFTDRLSTLWTTWDATVMPCKARYCSRVPCVAQRRWVHPRCWAALAVSSLGFFTFLNWNFVPIEHQLSLRTPTSIPTPLQPLAPTNVFSDSVNLTILGTLPGEGHGNPLQYSCLENPMDRSLAGKLQSMESESDRAEST